MSTSISQGPTRRLSLRELVSAVYTVGQGSHYDEPLSSDVVVGKRRLSAGEALESIPAEVLDMPLLVTAQQAHFAAVISSAARVLEFYRTR